MLVVAGPDGLVMINGGRSDRSTELLKMVSGYAGGRRLTTIFNTDWCADHTGSNEAIGAIGAQIVAHEHTKQYLANDQFVEWQKRTYKAKPPDALPTKTFYTKGSMTVGSERLDYGHLGQAHTDGDIYVFLPASNVLVAGDVLTVGKYPIADYTTGGWLGGLVTATKTLLDMSNAETRIIPGTGPVQTRADLQAQYDMLEHDARSLRQDDAAGHGRERHARRRRDEGLRREVGRPEAVRVGHLSRPVAARARARRHRVTSRSAPSARGGRVSDQAALRVRRSCSRPLAGVRAAGAAVSRPPPTSASHLAARD